MWPCGACGSSKAADRAGDSRVGRLAAARSGGTKVPSEDSVDSSVRGIVRKAAVHKDRKCKLTPTSRL